jgi:hypothetical protein
LLASSPSAIALMRRSDSTRSLMSRTIALCRRSSPWPESPSENSTGNTGAVGAQDLGAGHGAGRRQLVRRGSRRPPQQEALQRLALEVGRGAPGEALAERFTLRTRLRSSKVTIASKAVSNTAWTRSAWRRVTSISWRARPVENWRRHTHSPASASATTARSMVSSPARMPRDPRIMSARSTCATRPQPRPGSLRVTAMIALPRRSMPSTLDSTPAAAIPAIRARGSVAPTRSPPFRPML